ncbi:MAG: small basic protein [Phycisphaerales bacterium]|nr:small basic protein [Phycisphaerales bacterium]
MSIHPSLKTKSGGLNQHRNVLTRTERIAKLTELELFHPTKNTALSLPKVRSIKAAVAKKPKKDAVAGADAAAPAAGAAPAAAKTAAKPAGGDKKK